jgi:hypothetical protein
MQVGDFKLSSLPDVFEKQKIHGKQKVFFDSKITGHPNEGDTTPVFEDSKNSRSMK